MVFDLLVIAPLLGSVSASEVIAVSWEIKHINLDIASKKQSSNSGGPEQSM